MSDPQRAHFKTIDTSSRTSPSIGGSLTFAAHSLRRQVWLAPLLTACALATLGWFLDRTVQGSLRGKLAEELQALLNADLSAMELWLKMQRENASDTANEPAVATAIVALAAQSERGASAKELIDAPQQAQLRDLLNPERAARDFHGYVITNAQGIVISSLNRELIGKDTKNLCKDLEFLRKTLAGEATVSQPMPSVALLSDGRGKVRSGVPTMFACAPVRDKAGAVVGVLGLRLPPEADFTRILNVARFGKSGETYAFDRSGLLLSSSRFDAQLKTIGLLPDNAEAASILTVRLFDPQVDLTRGERPVEGAEKRLTRMAADATEGNSGIDVDGYRDYRGVRVIGAWRWLPQYNFGVSTEVDEAEALEALGYLQVTFWGIFGLLVLASLGMLVAMLWVSRMRLALKQAAVESQKLGQYTLETKLGEGGMGVVYRARHAFLRRPTAVKMLHPKQNTDTAIRRFECEVQLTSQLTHPNTIAIYDYGRTDEGIFYYVMEYLDGIALDTLVRRFGPQPDGRVIDILRQLCGSLAEAHSCGLIHRDVKPANILLNQRGRQYDVVKVLDFGLVKMIDSVEDIRGSRSRAIIGTPHYMSPESITSPESIDARSDLYAVGAVGYFLLAGQNVFEGESVVDICNQHLDRAPVPPSKRTPTPISTDLEEIILRCLSKRREDRPQSAEALAEMLSCCTAAGSWTRAAAEQWWQTVKSDEVSPSGITVPETTNQHMETIVLPVE